MYQNQIRQMLATIAAVAAGAALAAPTAGAMTVPGDPTPTEQRVATSASTSPGGCTLQRVGSQLVRCDDLTGNGVPASHLVPERA